jgi:D-3-phosphoglycerate dehydrogenase
LECQGDIASQDQRLLLSAFCAGLLRNVSDNVNIVNAKALAEERGIRLVSKSTAEHGAFSSVIGAIVSGEDKTLQAAGTVFGRNMPRLIRVGEYRTEAYMDGILLVFTHRDIPGVIGYVGTVLAEDNVNIAQMAVGRVSNIGGGPAIGVLNLDSPASPQALQRTGEFAGIESVRMIQLPGVGEMPVWLR